MDEPHLLAALRYLALKPVKARLAAAPADWPWSSTSAHLRRQDNGLVTVRPLLERVEHVAQCLDRPEDPERSAALTRASGTGSDRRQALDGRARASRAWETAWPNVSSWQTWSAPSQSGRPRPTGIGANG